MSDIGPKMADSSNCSVRVTATAWSVPPENGPPGSFAWHTRSVLCRQGYFPYRL